MSLEHGIPAPLVLAIAHGLLKRDPGTFQEPVYDQEKGEVRYRCDDRRFCLTIRDGVPVVDQIGGTRA